MEKYQEYNPFKLIVVAAQIDQALPQINLRRESPPTTAGR